MAAEDQYLAFTNPGTPTRVSLEGATIASAATIAPTARQHTVSGTAAVSLITLPYAGFAGTIYLFPTGAFTGATGGTATTLNKPVGLAWTAVVGRVLAVTYLPSTGLWHPHY